MDQGEHAGCSRGKVEHKMKSFLSDALQSWTINDIMDDDLQKKKVLPIPPKFRSAQDYFDIQSQLLIEEVRETLKSSVLDIKKTQVLHITAAQEIGGSILFLDIDLNKARSSDDECLHIANDFDMFVLSCESPIGLNFTEETCCLGMAIDVGEDTYYQKSFTVLVSKGKIQPEKIKFVTFLTNLRVKIKISAALSLDDKQADSIETVLNLQKSLCQDAGYDKSLFERFRSLSTKMCMLKTQHMMDPLVSEFPRKYIYGKRIVNSKYVESSEYNKMFRKTRYPQYAILEIPVMNNQGHVGSKNTAQSAAIMALLESLYADMNADVGIKIGVICLSTNDANIVRSQLTSKHKLHDKIILEVKSIDSLKLDWFDVVILSTLAQDYTKIQPVKETSLTVALTCSRHLCWIVGISSALLSFDGIWRKLIADARGRKVIRCLDGKLFSDAVNKLEMNDEDSFIDKSALEKENLCKVGQEITWVGRPHKTKYILSHVRDQKDDCDSCTVQTSLGTVESIKKHQHASLVPPQDFNWKLSAKDLKDQYEKKVGKKLSDEEDSKKKGTQRLTTNLDILQEHGVKGSNGVESEDRIFKISSYSLLKPMDVKKNMARLMRGDIMPCHFRLSRNYFYLQPGEVYQYDEKCPYIHKKSGLPVSHAVMMVGGGILPLPHAVDDPQARFHTIFQNSEGGTFGIGGRGKVLTCSLKGLYHVRIRGQTNFKSRSKGSIAAEAEEEF